MHRGLEAKAENTIVRPSGFTPTSSAMDKPRPDVARKKRKRRIMIIAGSALGLILVTVLLSRLKPAVPSVDRSTVWIDTVKRGPMLRQVRGLGTLVPEDIQWIATNTVRGAWRNRRSPRREGNQRYGLTRAHESGTRASRA